jgi:hypothetical protein
MTATNSHVTTSQSHVTTEGLLASESWFQAPSRDQDRTSVTVRHYRFCRFGAPSLTRGRVYYLLAIFSNQSARSVVISQLIAHRRSDFLAPGPLRLTTCKFLFCNSTIVVIAVIQRPLLWEDGCVSYEYACPVSSVGISH